MQRETTISRWCERITEACWLLALTLIPIFFNLYSARHFEPDKAVTLRALALVAVSAALIRWLDGAVARADKAPAASEPRPTGPPLWRRLAAVPLAVPALLYALVFLVTTATSVVPATSFWGSYQRLQGTYTNLSYILIFVAIVSTLRRREQLERVVTITLAAATAVAGYGLLQHLQLDPLPWRGDVITRVASTMGNSIFVAAYMIMVVPFALFRLVGSLHAAREAPFAERPGAEWLWALVRGLFLAGGLLLLLTAIKFGAAVRTVDFRYWWVLPGAVVVATALWWLLTSGFERSDRRPPIWPGALALGYLLAFGVLFSTTAGAGLQRSALPQEAPRAVDWWLWLFLAMGMLTAAYGMAFTLPRLPARPSRLALRLDAAAAGAVTLLLLAAIFFTQSRGPWLGIAAGLFVFFSLLLWQAMRHARATGALALAGRLRALLAGWVLLSLLAGAFLLAFNLSDAPVFQRLREVPYLGRMGRLLEVDTGTGLVRRLIWAGDEHAGGAIGLITSNPLRTLIGWGPESMFVAYNPFYPPSLANIEARGASPDRSHQAILDELVTKGLLGLASYIFLLFSAVALLWRLIRRSDEWPWQVFFIACLSTITAHVVEGLTGIPIVSTLTMLWVTLGLAVTGGALAGHYSLSLAPAPAAPAEPAETPAPAAPAPPKGAQQPRRRQPAPRGAAGRGAAAPRRSPSGAAPGTLLAYGVVAALALGGAWWWNLSPIYADMHFQQGQGLSEQGDLNLNTLVQSVDEYLQTIRSNPREDFYYLNLGRVLMTMAEGVRSQGVELGEPGPSPDVASLLRLRDQQAIVGFVQQSSPMQLMGYAEAVLLRAHDLNPRNKDHYANLGRLNSFWYAWTEDPTRLRTSLDWYERVTPIAPQDVTLLNERAGVVQQLGDYAARNNDQAQAQSYYDQARELLLRSEELDPRYADTYLRLGDLSRAAQDLDGAVEQYVQAVGVNGALVANSIERIADALADRPDLILRLRDAYEAHTIEQTQRLAALESGNVPAEDVEAQRGRVALLHTVTGLLSVRGGDVGASVGPYRAAAELQPARPDYSTNYTIVLSDTQQYDLAIAEARRSAELQRSLGNQQAAGDAEQLITLVEQARGGQ